MFNNLEMIINDKPDLKLNLELWGKKYNILFITGLSGSGKTQLSKEISSKNNAKIIHLDELQFFITRGIFNNMNTFVYKYIKENDIKYADNKKLNFYMTRFIKFLIENLSKDKDNLYIIEGMQLFTLIKPEFFKNKCIIVRGVGPFRSTQYKIKRKDENNREVDENYINKALKRSIRYSKKLDFFRSKLLEEGL